MADKYNKADKCSLIIYNASIQSIHRVSVTDKSIFSFPTPYTKKSFSNANLNQILFNVYHASSLCSHDVFMWVGRGEKYKQAIRVSVIIS